MAKKKKGFSKFWKNFITCLQVVNVVGLWICALTAFISPEYCKALVIFSLGFPIALLATFVSLLLSLIFTFKRSWISAVGLLACAGSIRTYVPMNVPHTAPSNSFSVMTYNTHNLGKETDPESGRHEMMEYLRHCNVDIVVAQEAQPTSEMYADSLKSVYPYWRRQMAGAPAQVIFSKFPIVADSLLNPLQQRVVVYWVKVSPQDTVGIVSCHLQSTRLKSKDRENFGAFVYNKTENADDMESSAFSIVSSLMENSKKRAVQVDSIASLLEKFEGKKIILCGDFNDTPISYTREKIRSSLGLTDCFRATGNGVGRSFNRYGMYVRIDHMFCSDKLKPYEAKVDKGIFASDHYPMICRFKIDKK